MPMRRVLAGMCAIGAVSPCALAFSSGAPGGFNGSILSGGASCSVCHFDNQPRNGFVEILGAPLSYAPGQTYDLTVRVSDPDRVAGGFQLSVESGDGSEAGLLEIMDAARTRYASSQTTQWVTHTRTGYDEALASWAGDGNSASFTVRWTAPQGDAGELTFYAAGNAVNNDGDLTGDAGYVATASAEANLCPADFNGDQTVDSLDLVELLSAWRTGPGPADLNGDGDVTAVDLAYLLNQWGACAAP